MSVFSQEKRRVDMGADSEVNSRFALNSVAKIDRNRKENLSIHGSCLHVLFHDDDDEPICIARQQCSKCAPGG